MTNEAPRKANLIDEQIGQRFRLRRTAVGLTQADLAKLLGVTFQQIQKYERGINRISASRLYEAAKHLDISISYFFESGDGDLI
ncbi:helix-turn-helix domain-containing protein [Acidocella aminolytica]|uniref:HTH cro/C1-type domain-containing protein n=2 Tax=Acidocella TaxID=50709 RepID=A0A0D6PBY6_9PROT|nr:helix-turn-helix transcriptional regulator [Acidocella aminolytica]GAN78876.1 hypothetical protein Aam_010_054 [Acidocella aminolytica 101 = DSM 11237]